MTKCSICGHDTNRASICGPCILRERDAAKGEGRKPVNLRAMVQDAKDKDEKRRAARGRKQYMNARYGKFGA